MKTHTIHLYATTLALCLGSYAATATACDLCALYTSLQVSKPKAGALQLGISEQFTGFDRLQEDGNKLENPEHQNLQSSITQVLAVYGVTDFLQLQATVPFINRRYARFEDGTRETGAETGFGDTVLSAKAFPYAYAKDDVSILFNVTAGIKLPTGDSGRLREELGEEPDGSHHESKHSAHHDEENDAPAGAVHGHDLALGSGSVDFLIGGGLFTRWDRFFASADVQYMIRTEGDYSYKYANDLLWYGGPGAYLHLEDDAQVALRATLSGEFKRDDRGQDDTAINSFFMGPELLITGLSCLSGNVGFDIPIDIKNSGVQAVPTYRIRAGLTYRF
jgi:hypothetical protein